MARYEREYIPDMWGGHYRRDPAYGRDERFNRWGSSDAGYRGGYAYDRDPYGADDRDGYKSSWETRFGDPYGDRMRHTPVRVMRGSFDRGYDRDVRRGYDRGYGSGRYTGFDRPRDSRGW
jgi:hypothetical protein